MPACSLKASRLRNRLKPCGAVSDITSPFSNSTCTFSAIWLAEILAFRFILDNPSLPSSVHSWRAPSQLAAISLAIALPLGILLGSASSWKTRPAAQRTASTLSGLATSLPVATTGVISLLIVGFLAKGQARGVQLWLPALVLGFAASGPFARAVHSGLESSLSSPYILAAKARGLRRGRRIYWHALRPALPAAITLIALEAAFLFAGAVVTETVFSSAGVGADFGPLDPPGGFSCRAGYRSAGSPALCRQPDRGWTGSDGCWTLACGMRDDGSHGPEGTNVRDTGHDPATLLNG